MVRSDEKPATPDILWKELIKKFFRDFVAFYKPDLLPEVIFGKTEFLDKELLSITGRTHKGIVDVLAKVHLKKGGTEFILFHIEVQGYHESKFQARMFSYFIRIWDRYRKPVTALAVITPGFGKGPASNVFSFDSFRTHLRYEYDLFDIRNLRYADCLHSKNPVQVAAAILVESPGIPLWKKKFEVIRRLVKLGLTHEEIHLLISYVDRYSRLKGKQLEEFESFVMKDKKEVGMIMTSFEEKALRKGRVEGRVEGREEGKIQDAERMVARGMSNADIRDITGLSIKKIQEIRNRVAKK